MWCAGCGNGIVLNALLCALDDLDLKKEDVLVVTGIGCWGKADDYILGQRSARDARPRAGLCHRGQGG